MKIGDQKVKRTLKKQMVRGSLQDKKVPGTSSGTRATAAPGPSLLGLQQCSWERVRLTAPSPDKQGLSSTQRDLVAWGRREGNKAKVVNPQRLWAPTWESWELGCVGPWPGQSPVELERWAVWEDRPFFVWSSRFEQEVFLKKKKTLGVTLGNSCAATAPVFSPPGSPALSQVSGAHQA